MCIRDRVSVGGVSFIIREPPVYVDKRGLMFDNIELQWQGYPAAA